MKKREYFFFKNKPDRRPQCWKSSRIRLTNNMKPYEISNVDVAADCGCTLSSTKEIFVQRMSFFAVVVISALLLCCEVASAQLLGSLFGSQRTPTLDEERAEFKTHLTRKESANKPVPEPPADVFRVVEYVSPVGKLAAYVTLDPKDGTKHPAIIWITGGDCNTIGDVWSDRPADNDQSACAYRKAGIVMMFPSLRGGNQNPGFKEGFLGEIDDVLAAADFLAKQDFVDPKRIYLGGHSTGGTVAMLAAESSPRFRAVFSFGPVDTMSSYPPEILPFDPSPSLMESYYRSPTHWMNSIQSPLFVIEGNKDPIEAINVDGMGALCKNPLGHFYLVENADHFTVLAPVNKLLAERIIQDNGPKLNIKITSEELGSLFKK